MSILKDNPPGPGDSGRTLKAALFATALVLGVSRLWVAGYSFGTADHAWQVPLVKGLATGAPMKDYIFEPVPRLSFFFPLVSLAVRVFPIEVVYLTLYIVASVAACAGLYLFSSRMLASRPAGLIAVIVLMVGKDTFAGSTTWDPQLLPRTAALPFVFFAWYLFLAGSPLWSGLLTGISFALHPLTGTYCTAVSMAAILLAERETWRPLWKFTAGVAVPTAATIAYTWGMPAAILSASVDWYDVMLIRNVHHLTVSNMALPAGVLLFAMGAIVHVGLSGGRSRLLVGATAAAAVVYTYYAIARLAGLFAGFRETDMALMKPPLLALFQPLRMTALLGVLLFIATSGMIWRAMQKGAVARVAAAGATVAFMWSHYAVGLLFLAAALASQEHSRTRKTAALAATAAALIATLIFHKTLLVLLSAVVVASFIAGLAGRNTKVSAAWATLATAVVLLGLFPSGWAARAAARTFGSNAGPDTGRYNRGTAVSAEEEEAVRACAEWAARAASPEDMFIVPPWWETFRVLSGRPVYGTYKDGTLAFFNERIASQWLDRMLALKVPLRSHQGSRLPESDRADYALLSESQVSDAARRHGARYIVRPAQDMAGMNLVYETAGAFIYEIPADGVVR